MKKYLLFLFAMFYGSIGAWAASYPVNFGTNSSYEISGTTLTVNVGTRGDLANWSPIPDLTGINKVVVTGIIGSKQDASKDSDSNANGHDSDGMALKNFASCILDLSNANMPVATFATPGVVVGENAIYSKNIIVPSVYANDPSSFPAYQAYGSISSNSINLYSISGTTLKASLGELSSANLAGVKGGCTTLEVMNGFSNGDLSSSGFNTIDFTNTTLTGTTNVPEGSTVYVNTTAEKSYISGSNVTVQARFNGTATVAAGGNLGTNITNALSGYETNNTLANITTLNITGEMTAADVSWLETNKSSLTGLTTVNLTGLSGFGSTVSKATIAAALPSGVAINYPDFFVDNNSTTGVTTIDVQNAGSVTAAALSAKGLFNSNTQATIKIVGDVTSSDISSIVALSNFTWSTRRIDLSEATVTDEIPRISGCTDPNDPYYIILPPGTSAPTEEQVAYYTDNSRKEGSVNGIYNDYDDLKYIIIPAAEKEGHAKIFINRTKDGNAPITTSIEPYDIAVINANKPSVIDVYNLDNAFGQTGFETLQSSINSTWSGKTVIYHETMDPMVIDGCNVTIDMNEAGSKPLATLISEADTEVKKTISTGICSLTINGPLSAGDVTALNTAMGSGSNLASITGLYLGGATGVSQEQVNGLNIPTTLTRLTIPSDRIVAGGLVTKAKAATSLNYVYSPTSSSSRTVAEQFSPDYVYVLNPGSLSTAVSNEEGLQKGVYIKIGTPSDVNLSVDDAKFGSMSIDFTDATNYGWQYIDMSGAGVTAVATLAETAPNKDYGYRIVLPDGLTGDNMAIFASNPDHGKVAAVYSYTGTKLNLMEITDDKYAHSALADSRIMRSTTTEVEVVSGTYNGDTYSAFGNNLLIAINNMGNSTSYPSSTGLNVKKVSISTGANVTSPMNFNNPTIETLELKNVSLAWAVLNVDACSSLKTLNLNYANIGSVSAKVSGLTKVDLSGATINNNNTLADFSGAALTNGFGFITDDDTHIFGDLTLKSTGLTSFTPQGIVGGDIYLNASASLASIDLRQVTLGANKIIHIDSSTEETNTSLELLHKADAITVPTGFASSDRFHPYDDVKSYIKEEPYIPPMVTITRTDMKLHEKEAAANGDYFIYWYQDTSDKGKNVTIGTGKSQSLSSVLTNKSSELDFTNTTYRRGKITGPVTSSDISSLASINCQVLDLSKATFDAEAWAELKKAFASTTSNVHSNVRFVILPDGSKRDDILNGTALAGLSKVLSVIATEKITGAADASDNGTNLTTWSRVSGAVQAAVVAAGNHSCASWIKTPDGKTARNIYTTDISDFKVCQISGLINSHDLSKANQQLDANGHLSWDSDPVEISSGTDPRVINGGHTAYGPFSASFQLTAIDLRDAYFEPVNDSPETEYKRYYFSDMTLSALGIISSDTYKVVIPQTSTVREIPADFMNCSTGIRAICIPSNIRAIRTRAFYTIDYVWTTGDVAKDPEGANTKLDNGAKVKKKGGSAYESISATIYNADEKKFVENPAFTKEYYVGDYSSSDGGGTYTIGSNIKLIETGAFANTQPHVTDVYVLNTTAPECHVDAFNTVMYAGNNGYESIAVGEKIIKRSNYINNGYWITMLHYPRQTTTPNLQRYTDPTRQYSIATGERDGKGAMLYFPNQSEFIRAYNQGTYGYIWNAWSPERTYGSVTNPINDANSGWDASKQAEANAAFNAYTSGVNHEYTSFYKVNWDGVTTSVAEKTSGAGDVVPYYQVGWNETNYSTVTSNGLYPQSEKDAGSDVDKSGEQTSKDYRGWHQFVLNAYAANTVLEEEPYRSYISDNDWWTFCPTIDMTKKQVMELFGSSTTNLPYVSRLLYVRREYADNTIWLNFSNNLMVYKEDREYSKPTTTGEGDGAVTTPASQHGQTDETTGIVKVSATKNSVDDDDVVMSAGVPYLIKPYRVADASTGQFFTEFRVFKTDEEAAKLTDATVKIIVDEDLYNKLNNTATLDGATQIAKVESGLYTVPVFVKGDAQSGTTKESVDKTSYSIGEGEGYNKSTTWGYTFVGSHYLSPLPQYCYYLGKKSVSDPVTFIYNNFTPYSTAVFRWVNETAVICPTKNTSPTFKVTPASGVNAAVWNLNTKDNTNNVTTNTYLEDDSFATTSSTPSQSRGNLYNMHFGAEPVVAHGETVGIIVETTNVTATNGKVYSLDGRLKGTSLNGLSKGIYIVNGKKHVIK